jgi:hypothetical protein
MLRPNCSPMAADRRDRFRVYFCRASGEVARQILTRGFAIAYYHMAKGLFDHLVSDEEHLLSICAENSVNRDVNSGSTECVRQPEDCHRPFVFPSHTSDTHTPVVTGVRFMGMLMIRCPKTGRAVSTGRYVLPATFRCSPVFFGRTYCPLCQVVHEWFAKDAWVCETEPIGTTLAALGHAATRGIQPKSEPAIHFDGPNTADTIHHSPIRPHSP